MSPWEVAALLATTARRLVVPAPTLAEGAGFVVLWARFTGRVSS